MAYDVKTDLPLDKTSESAQREATRVVDGGDDRVSEASEESIAAALVRALDGRWHDVREQARAFELRRYDPPSYELSSEQHRSRVLERLFEFAASGLPQVGFDPAYGGAGELGAGMVAIEMLGFRDLSLMVKAGVQWGLYAGAIAALGTGEQHDRYLRAAIELDTLGCFAMTESGHGSDVQSLQTTATYRADTEEFEVHTPEPAARKEYIGNAARDGQLAVVFAQLRTGDTDHGVHAIVVPIRDADGESMPGVTISDCGRKAGLNGVDNGRLSFDQVRVPRANLLDRYGQVDVDGSYTSPIDNPNRRFFTMLGTLVRGRVSVGAAAQSATKHALTIACRRGLYRRQFPRPGADGEILLMDYLAHQRRLLPALATSYALSFAQDQLTVALHELWSVGERDEKAQREIESRAAGLKAISTWHATSTIQTCRETCGGAGYLAENTLAQLKSDTDIFTTFEGDNTVLLQLVGKGLLTNYAEQFEDLNMIGTVRFAADAFVGAAIERTAARQVIQRLSLTAARRDGAAELRDRRWQMAMLEDREKHLVETLAARMRSRIGRGGDHFEAFNQTQPHLLAAARAHVERTALEAFIEGIDNCEEPGAAELLGTVCDLFVLSLIERDRAWFLEHNRMGDRRAKDLTQTVDDLCAELRPHVAVLVDGFGIPDTWIDAPIASPDSID